MNVIDVKHDGGIDWSPGMAPCRAAAGELLRAFDRTIQDTLGGAGAWALLQGARALHVAFGAQFGREVASRVHAGLKRTGGVRPPREFVLMDRSAVGLGSVFLRLKAELNWSRMFHDLIADFNADTLATRQAAALAAAGVPPPA